MRKEEIRWDRMEQGIGKRDSRVLIPFLKTQWKFLIDCGIVHKSVSTCRRYLFAPFPVSIPFRKWMTEKKAKVSWYGLFLKGTKGTKWP